MGSEETLLWGPPLAMTVHVSQHVYSQWYLAAALQRPGSVHQLPASGSPSSSSICEPVMCCPGLGAYVLHTFGVIVMPFQPLIQLLKEYSRRVE
jgi:hypothetical protein